MGKIRLIPLDKEEKDKFEVYVPGRYRDYPIGRIWYDLMKNKWLLKPYFLPMTRDELKKNRLYEDSMEAARMLKKMFERVDHDFSDDHDFGIEERVEDTEPMFQIPLFSLDDYSGSN
jgi:hypothetical protein|tara:strand:- start:377 stop:727 length:351 start_codon:yes stop_codon:yes gene_type:complete